jgi:alanine racemase
VSVGDADGWHRALSIAGAAWFGDVELPIVGKVSMDTVTLDASALPEARSGRAASSI